jgi:hypothetical protein
MSILGIIVTAVIAVLGVAYLALPVIRRHQALQGLALKNYKDREMLLTAYERVLITIRDLDEDYQVGKLDAAQYQAERELWAGRGVEVLEALEKAGGAKFKGDRRKAAAPAPAVSADADGELDAALEQAIARYVTAKAGK